MMSGPVSPSSSASPLTLERVPVYQLSPDDAETWRLAGRAWGMVNCRLTTSERTMAELGPDRSVTEPASARVTTSGGGVISRCALIARITVGLTGATG